MRRHLKASSAGSGSYRDAKARSAEFTWGWRNGLSLRLGRITQSDSLLGNTGGAPVISSARTLGALTLAIACFGLLSLVSLTAPAQGETRVYEKVSPADKNSVGVLATDDGTASEAGYGHFGVHAQASDNGDAVAYGSVGNFGGDGGVLKLQYVSRRNPDSGWSTRGITPPTAACSAISGNEWAGYQYLSDDLNWGMAGTCIGMNPGDPPEARHLYLRDIEADTYQLLSVSDLDPPAPQTSVDCFIGSSADLSHIVFEGTTQLTEPQTFLYEWVEGVGVRPVAPDGGLEVFAGGVPLVGDVRCGANYPGDHPVSADGSRIYFTAGFNSILPQGLYVRESGTTTRLVSVSEIPGPVPAGDSARFELARVSDGGVAFFSDVVNRTPGATADDGSADLYRWDANAPAGSQLTDITTQDPDGGGVISTVLAGDDATMVYFLAEGNLAPGAVDGQENLYLWQQGEGITRIATMPTAGDSGLYLGQGNAQRQRPRNSKRITPSGDQLAFLSNTQLTAYDNNGTTQVYLYDAPSDTLTCVSCNPRASLSQADAGFLRGHDNWQFPHNLSSDGQHVFFESAEALVPFDTNGRRDVYEWNDGVLSLISSGSSGTNSAFLDASPDGHDVFFTTAQRLVPSDADALTDLYDARIGGRAESVPPLGCRDDQCQGTPTPPPFFSTPSSLSFVGLGNAQFAAKKEKCGKGRVRKKVKCSRKRRQAQDRKSTRPTTHRHG